MLMFPAVNDHLVPGPTRLNKTSSMFSASVLKVHNYLRFTVFESTKMPDLKVTIFCEIKSHSTKMEFLADVKFISTCMYVPKKFSYCRAKEICTVKLKRIQFMHVTA